MATNIAAQGRTAAGEFVLELNARTVYRALLSAIGVLIVMSLIAKMVMLAYPASQYGAVNELCKRFYFDFENNVPAWFSTLGLFVSSGLFGLVAYFQRKRAGIGFWRWLGLCFLFIGLAIDEATFIHEILIVSLRDKLNLSGIFYFAWVIPGALFVLFIVSVYLPFIWKLPRNLRNGFLLAGATYVGGALGMELIGGYLAEREGFDAASYVLVMTIEETLEMFGIATLIFVLLRYLGWLCPQSMRIHLH